MKLHRTTGQPDWSVIKAGDHNVWQRLAASSKGALTPGNVVTVLGFAVVLAGLREMVSGQYWAGGILLALGRALDIADGWLADQTGTKSPLGELLDASLDKLGTLATMLVFWYSGVAPRWALLALILPQVITSIIVLWALRQDKPLHPSRAGKLSMFTAWLSLLGFVVIRAQGDLQGSLAAPTVYTLTGLSIILGLYAALGYARDRY